jgi:hypothetical protein
LSIAVGVTIVGYWTLGVGGVTPGLPIEVAGFGVMVLVWGLAEWLPREATTAAVALRAVSFVLAGVLVIVLVFLSDGIGGIGVVAFVFLATLLALRIGLDNTDEFDE